MIPMSRMMVGSWVSKNQQEKRAFFLKILQRNYNCPMQEYFEIIFLYDFFIARIFILSWICFWVCDILTRSFVWESLSVKRICSISLTLFDFVSTKLQKQLFYGIYCLFHIASIYNDVGMCTLWNACAFIRLWILLIGFEGWIDIFGFLFSHHRCYLCMLLILPLHKAQHMLTVFLRKNWRFL